MSNKSIKAILKKARIEKGYTMEDMAKMLGYKGKSGYWQLENGNIKVTIDIALKLAEMLDLNIEQFFCAPKVQVTSTSKAEAI
ncbi:MAG: hypothetical protein JM58_09215 [Peptococcaceae bacterium BICA1-8]|nr:MAG: hypothetical protein JM58_09215 [Peptococcaceae bacterium BICA1-8]